MSVPAAAIYVGDVTHRRLRPVHHGLRYRVFSLLVDPERLTETGRRLGLFSVGRFNLVSLYERDFGTGQDLGGHLRRIAAEAGVGDDVDRFRMLCYPRILGWVFNPLTVYYGLDADGRIRLMIYEVSNTFGERETYVVPTGAPTADGMLRHACDKVFYVSPFNRPAGSYAFTIAPPGDDVVVGVALSDHGAPLMNAVFRGAARPFTDRGLLAALAGTGWMTLKVSAGIRLEALKLWIKGLRPTRRPAHPPVSVTIVRPHETT